MRNNWLNKDLTFQSNDFDGITIDLTYWSIKVIWHSKALFFSHFLETATASVNGIFGQEEDHRQDKECENAKNDERDQAYQSKKLVHFMFNICNHFQVAELALLFHWSNKDKNIQVSQSANQIIRQIDR